MTLPQISLTGWWIATAAGIVFYLALTLPLMPNRSYRIKSGLIPVAVAALSVLFAVVKRESAAETLPFCLLICIAFPLGTLGKRQQLKEFYRDLANGRKASLPPGYEARVLIALTAVMTIMFWLRG